MLLKHKNILSYYAHATHLKKPFILPALKGQHNLFATNYFSPFTNKHKPLA